MSLTPEQITQLRTSAGFSPTPPQTGNIDILSQRKANLGIGKTDSEIPKIGGIGGFIADTSGLTGATKAIGGAINVAAEGLSARQITDRTNQVNKLIDQAKTFPVDSQQRKDLLKQAHDLSGKASDLADAAIAGLDKSPTALQSAGSFTKLGLTVASGTGLLEASPATSVLGKIGQGMLRGGEIGTALGGAQGAEDNKDLGGILKDAAIGGVGGAIIGGAIPAIGAGINALKSTPTSELNQITETVSPKLNAKELKLAIKDGRFVSGQDATLLRDGMPDSVIPSDKTIKVAQTIQENIPGASKMKGPELFKALNEKGVALRDELMPVMENTPINDETIQSISNKWDSLKAQQKANPYLSNNVNLEKLQNNFEENFLQKSGNKSMNDIWETTQAYDHSVPANVKNATALSSETLQDQKSIWLQNRSILTGATHNIATGLDETSQKTFSDMSNMYTAKENILSKAKLGKGTASKITQWVKDNPWRAGVVGLGIGQITGANKAVGTAVKALTGL